MTYRQKENRLKQRRESATGQTESLQCKKTALPFSDALLPGQRERPITPFKLLIDP
jgi:hypothetical protein